jgi:hypothetical protein
MTTYNVVLTRYYSDCVIFTVEADDIEKAKALALEQEESHEDDSLAPWPDHDETEIFQVEDLNGKVLYSRDEEVQS